jgi:anti-anti-sigma factor
MPLLQPPAEPSFTPSGGRTPNFDCVVRRNDRNAVWLCLSGDLDLVSASQLKQTVLDLVATQRLVVVDLRELTSMDSTGLHAIVEADNSARRRGVRLVLIRGPAQIDQLFELTGLTDSFDIVDGYGN